MLVGDYKRCIKCQALLFHQLEWSNLIFIYDLGV
jgi:hypothetical protein